MIKAVLFDSDGVLVDTERLFFETTRDAFADAGIDLPAAVWSRLYLAEGGKTPYIAARLGMRADLIPGMFQARNERFRIRMEEGPAALPGAREALDLLRSRFRLIMVTGADRRHAAMAHRVTGFLPLFDDIVTGDDFDLPKPSPDAYLTALRRAGLPAAEAWAVEDSPRGARSAVAAGLRCLIVLTPLTAVDLCPTEALIVPSLAAACDVIFEAAGEESRHEP
jgi:HAD superfamily hydrolase (TIGR01509 family)